MKFYFILFSHGLFNIFLRIAIRFYEIFPKKYGPFGFMIFGYCIGISIIAVYEFSCIIGFITDKYNDIVFVMTSFLMLISVLFLVYYFKDSMDEFLEAENEKGDRYIRNWRIITWVYLIISTLPLIQWFIKENLS